MAQAKDLKCEHERINPKIIDIIQRSRLTVHHQKYEIFIEHLFLASVVQK